jgi:hypothetical protein
MAASTRRASHDVIDIPTLPSVTHQTDYFRPGFLSMSIVGKSGCGKTQLLTTILPWVSHDVKTLIIATVMTNVPLHKAIVSWFMARNHTKPKGRQLPEYYSSIVYDPDELREAFSLLQELDVVSLDRPGLIIFDDFNDGRATGPYWNAVIHAFTKLRNIGWHFIILSQQPQFIPPIVRNCTNARALFACSSHTAIETFSKDVVDRVPDRECYERLIEYIHHVPYSYLMTREQPFDVIVGRGAKYRTVMTEASVRSPTYQEILRELDVHSAEELDAKSAEMQAAAGNTSSVVQRKLDEAPDDSEED